MRRIYDCDVNVWEPEHYLPLYYTRLGRVRPGGLPPRSDGETLVRELAKFERAILFSPRYGDSFGLQGDDAATAAAVARDPQKFVGFAYLDPREPDCLGILQRSVREYGFKGVKFGPIYNGVGLDDERMQPVYTWLQDNDLPLTLHMGTTPIDSTVLDFGRPLHVDAVARRYPQLKIALAHMGHPWVDECAVVVRKHANVYGEITGICYRPWIFYNALVAIREYAIVDKVFFGTDYPFSNFDEAVAGLHGANHIAEGNNLPQITGETIETILHSNPFAHWWHDRID